MPYLQGLVMIPDPRDQGAEVFTIYPQTLNGAGIVKYLNETYLVHIPIGSMYGIFTYIWLIFMVNVGKYTIHGCYGFIIYTIIP